MAPGVKPSLRRPEVLALWVAALPRTLAASAAQFLGATFARSYKEGQTYRQFLDIRPLLPGM